MRDAFGGSFLISVFLVFILIYIGFTSVSLNYAKAFRVKNAVIEYLENSEITDLNVLMTAEEMELMDQYFMDEVVGHYNYNLSSLDICTSQGSQSTLLKDDVNPNKVIGYCHNSGVIIKIAGEGENTEGVYYTVSTHIGWSIPFINSLLSLNGNNARRETPTGIWSISGQTRLIVNE